MQPSPANEESGAPTEQSDGAPPITRSSFTSSESPSPDDSAAQIADLQRQVTALQDWGDKVIEYLKNALAEPDPSFDLVSSLPKGPPR